MKTETLNKTSTQQDIDTYIMKLTNTITSEVNNHTKEITLKENNIGLPREILEMIKDKKIMKDLWKKKRNKNIQNRI